MFSGESWNMVHMVTQKHLGFFLLAQAIFSLQPLIYKGKIGIKITDNKISELVYY